MLMKILLTGNEVTKKKRAVFVADVGLVGYRTHTQREMFSSLFTPGGYAMLVAQTNKV